jgi:hypothetical protein
MTIYQVYEGKMNKQDQQIEWHEASYLERQKALDHTTRILEKYVGETIEEHMSSDGIKTWSVVGWDRVDVCILYVRETTD